MSSNNTVGKQVGALSACIHQSTSLVFLHHRDVCLCITASSQPSLTETLKNV